MADVRASRVLSHWAGPVLFALLAFGSWALLAGLADRARESWVAPVFAVIAAVLAAAYVLVVHLPQRRNAKLFDELQRRYDEQCAAMSLSLEELRHGDLVTMVEPTAVLPREMRDAVRSAASAQAALIQQIQCSSVEVAGAAGTVQRTSSELASASNQQAAAVIEITASTEELARTAGQIASNSAVQAELAARSESSGNEGAVSVEAAVAGVDTVRRHMEAVANRADALGKRSREIYRVLDLVTEISHETHILALNAAIEASSAGEHGERFSVVADEVRRLAERSRESIDSVRDHLDEFTGAIRGVTQATESGSRAAEQVLRLSRTAQSAISELRGALSETARAAREISLATEEQRAASDQVAVTLRDVGEVIQRIADGLGRYTDAAERLNQLALSIQLLTQSFRIDSPHSLKNQLLEWTSRLRDLFGNLEAMESLFADLLEAHPFLELVYLVDLSGSMMAFAVNRALIGGRQLPGSISVGRSYTERPWFKAVSRDQRSAVTPIYSSLLTGDQCFTIAVAVRDGDGEMMGILGVDVNLRNWMKI
jgi:methyl-accepting chemotaxis protein